MIKKAQDFPPPAAPPGGAPPPESAPPAPSFQEIHSPLDTLGKILADLNFTSFLNNNFGTKPHDLALKIWEMYGGTKDGFNPGKLGKRKYTSSPNDPSVQQNAESNEYNATRDRLWERLPEGKSINDITDTGSLEKAVEGGFSALSQQSKATNTSASLNQMIKLANQADIDKKYLLADKLQEKLIKCLHI